MEEDRCRFLFPSCADSGSAAVKAAGLAGGAVMLEVDSGAGAAEATVCAGDPGEGIDTVKIISPCLDAECGSEPERVRHLVQDEDLIAKIHNEELPPDSYYQMLGEALVKKFPTSTAGAREHVVALCAAFDTAAAFGLSLIHI